MLLTAAAPVRSALARVFLFPQPKIRRNFANLHSGLDSRMRLGNRSRIGANATGAIAVTLTFAESAAVGSLGVRRGVAQRVLAGRRNGGVLVRQRRRIADVRYDQP